MRVFEKRRGHAVAGSIPDVLDMFRSEVRFYREIAPVVGVRVPVCFEASITDQGTILRLEDLSTWSPGADPLRVAVQLRHLHERWEGEAQRRWPWLRPPGAAAELIAAAYERTWPRLATRSDLPPAVRHLGETLVGCVVAAELAEGTVGPITLCHGDTSADNLATGLDGQIAFFDWEDVRAAAGITDVAWLLLSSVHPVQWHTVESVYGTEVTPVLRSVAAQAFFALADHPEHSEAASGWITRLGAAAERLCQQSAE